jgi:hypothetical protein
MFPNILGAGRFLRIGIPYPDAMGPFVGVTEIVCGALIIAGLFTRLAAVPLRTSAASAPRQFQAGTRRRQADRRHHERRRDIARLSAIGIRLRRRQSGADVIPLSSTTAYGLRIHGAL